MRSFVRFVALSLVPLLLTACVDEAAENLDNFFINSEVAGEPAPTVSGSIQVGTSPRTATGGRIVANGSGAVMSFDLNGSSSGLLLSVPRKTGSTELRTGGRGPDDAYASGSIWINGTSVDLTGSISVITATVSPDNAERGLVEFVVNLSGANANSGGTTRALSGLVSMRFDNRSSGGSGGGGNLNLICPNVSAPYRCLTNSNGQQVPSVFNRPELHGTWVDEGVDLCITWNSDGSSVGRNRGGFGGGPRNFPGQWGVLVNSKGEFQPNANQWYVFTTGLDAQTQLLTFDKNASSPRQIIGWNFVKKACPW